MKKLLVYSAKNHWPKTHRQIASIRLNKFRWKTVSAKYNSNKYFRPNEVRNEYPLFALIVFEYIFNSHYTSEVYVMSIRILVLRPSLTKTLFYYNSSPLAGGIMYSIPPPPPPNSPERIKKKLQNHKYKYIKNQHGKYQCSILVQHIFGYYVRLIHR